jgi:topoisomerase-4 subunit A
VACASSSDRLLVFPLAEVRQMPKGRGVILMGLGDKDSLKLVSVFTGALSIKGIRRGRAVEDAVRFDVAKRARMGTTVNMKIEALLGGI